MSLSVLPHTVVFRALTLIWYFPPKDDIGQVWHFHLTTAQYNFIYSSTFLLLLQHVVFEWHIFLQPISSREEAAVCLITWPISCHATRREWEWDGGSAAGVRSNGTAGALPLQTSEATGLVPAALPPFIREYAAASMLIALTLSLPKCSSRFQHSVAGHSGNQTPNLKRISAPVTSNGSEQMNVQCDNNINATTQSLHKP